MVEGVRAAEERVVRAASLLLVGAAAIRLLASVVAGFVEWHDSSGGPFPADRFRASFVLTTFGAAGDGTGVLLLLAAAAGAWWLSDRRDPSSEALSTWIVWLFGATALLAVLEGVGVGVLYSIDSGEQTSRLIQAEGYALAYVVVAVGGAVLLSRLGRLLDERLPAGDVDAFVFAVDRHTGDVRAFLSVGEAARRMHVYSVEEDEFVFYTDEGAVLAASIENDHIVLRPTEHERPDELLEALKEFANRRGIKVDAEDADDPTAYALPISRWHFLEMWPPWMRPIGMLFRRTG